MTIATYNVNGTNARLPELLRWLAQTAPDVVCLQELKASQDKFPQTILEQADYQAIWKGQKSWNGVAILVRLDKQLLEIRRELPGEEQDEQSRYLETHVDGTVIGCLYLPNGNPAPRPKFDYKLRWVDHLIAHATTLLAAKLPAVLAGDFNVIPPQQMLIITNVGWQMLYFGPIPERPIINCWSWAGSIHYDS